MVEPGTAHTRTTLPNPHIPRVDVLGVGVSVVNMESTIAEIARWIKTREQHHVCVTGVHGVMESQADRDLLSIHNAAGLTLPDGMPMVWAGKWAGFAEIDRVCGPDLMPELLRYGSVRGWKHFFYGGAEGVPEELADRFKDHIPGLDVVGTYSPPFRPLTEGEESGVAAMIESSGADIVWVGLSTPKQEKWMASMKGRFEAPVVVAVGAAFDFHTGRIQRAPTFMRRTGFEWVYRMVKEPRRLAKRYLTNNPRFVLAVLRRRPKPLV